MIQVDWNDNGRPYVIPGTGSPLLSDFLETDVQDYWHVINEISAAIERLQHGHYEQVVSFYGNLYDLSLGPEVVVIKNMYEDSVSLQMSFGQFVQAFTAWIAALRSH